MHDTENIHLPVLVSYNYFILAILAQFSLWWLPSLERVHTFFYRKFLFPHAKHWIYTIFTYIWSHTNFQFYVPLQKLTFFLLGLRSFSSTVVFQMLRTCRCPWCSRLQCPPFCSGAFTLLDVRGGVNCKERYISQLLFYNYSCIWVTNVIFVYSFLL